MSAAGPKESFRQRRFGTSPGRAVLYRQNSSWAMAKRSGLMFHSPTLLLMTSWSSQVINVDVDRRRSR